MNRTESSCDCQPTMQPTLSPASGGATVVNRDPPDPEIDAPRAPNADNKFDRFHSASATCHDASRSVTMCHGDVNDSAYSNGVVDTVSDHCDPASVEPTGTHEPPHGAAENNPPDTDWSGSADPTGAV